MNKTLAASFALILLLLSACSKVNYENYQKIENGMSFSEITDILGKADVNESVSLAGISTSRAEWHGADGVISVRFIETKVRAKNWEPKP